MNIKNNLIKLGISILLIMLNNSIVNSSIYYVFSDPEIIYNILSFLINLISCIGVVLSIYFSFKILAKLK